MARMPSPVTADHRQFSPLLKPDWRWKAALERRASGLRRRPWEDRLIDPAASYLKDIHRLGTVQADRRQPELARAVAINREGGPLRDEIEARLLTRVPVEEIAGKTGVDTAVVTAYEQNFFNVRDRLDAFDWILNHAVDVFPGRTLTEGKIWKYLAVAGGPVVLDILVDDLHGRPDADVAGRTLLARKGRFIVRQFVTDWWAPGALAAILDECRELFPEIWNRPVKTADDRMFAVQLKFLEMLADSAPLAEHKSKQKKASSGRRNASEREHVHGREKQTGAAKSRPSVVAKFPAGGRRGKAASATGLRSQPDSANPVREPAVMA